MAWSSPQGYWGSSARRKRPNRQRGQGKGQDKQTDKEQKDANNAKGQFPSYDTMRVEQSSSASSSASGSSADAALQRAMRHLLESNPSLNVPKEVEEVLGFQDAMTKTAKDEMYAQQKALNARRKVTTKIDKLQQALTRKGLQMTAYKEEMKQKLATELERVNKEKQEISEALEQARAQLKKIENGEDIEQTVEEPNMDMSGDSLAQLLGVQEADQQEVDRLKAEKTYAEAVVAQLQQQVQFLMNAATAHAQGHGNVAPFADQMMGAGNRVDSPQLPGLGSIQGLPGMQRKKLTGRPAPYVKEDHKEQKNLDKKEQDGVELVMDSPELGQMDR